MVGPLIWMPSSRFCLLITQHRNTPSRVWKLNANRFLKTTCQLITSVQSSNTPPSLTAKNWLKSCMKIVNDNAKAVFESDSFLSVSHQVLELIVEKSSTTTPLDIYKACKKWAKCQFEKQEGDVSCEQIRDLLGVITSKIKFCEMSYEKFMDYIVKDQILSSDQVVKILLVVREKEKEEKKSRNIREKGNTHSRKKLKDARSASLHPYKRS